MTYIPVVIESCVEPLNLEDQDTFENAIDALVLFSVHEDTDDSENGTFVMCVPDRDDSNAYDLPSLESFSHGGWEDAKDRLLASNKITQEQYDRLH